MASKPIAPPRFQGLAFALALAAIMVRVFVPSGFMTAPNLATTGKVIPLVICTGHGPITAPQSDPTGKPIPVKASAECAFAALALATAIPPLLQVAGSSTTYHIAAEQIPPGQQPGRGLPAPPPPQTGPPAIL
jgi:hypothetical protein